MTKIKTFSVCKVKEECFRNWESVYDEINTKINDYAKEHNLYIKHIYYDRIDVDVIANVLFESEEVTSSSFD